MMNQVLCTICMRGGSKGVPNKNLREINGKPLMAYTIEQAINCGVFKHVVVSTDSKNIADTAKSFGADAWFIRPAELSTDHAPKLPVIRHAFNEAEKYYNHNFDVLVDLDATSPLRNSSDISLAYEQFINDDAINLISASPCRKNPYFNMVEKVGGNIELVKKLNNPIIRRQDAPKVFDMNASIYIWKRKFLLKSDNLFVDKTSLYIMPEERSVDIDTELDWKFVEFLLSQKNN